MEFSNPSDQWIAFSMMPIFFFLIFSLWGGGLEQDRQIKTSKGINNVLILKTMLKWGVIALPFGVLLSWNELTSIYRLDCYQGSFRLLRALSGSPIMVPEEDLVDVRLGMTSSKGDSWVINLYVRDDGNTINYSTTGLKVKDAKLYTKSILSMKRNCHTGS